MKRSILALPSLLRAHLYLAAASQNTFSPHDDLLAFPQFEVNFSDDYLLESQAQGRLQSVNDIDRNVANEGVNIDPYTAQFPTSDIPRKDDEQKDEVKLEYQSMMLDGQKYLCSIPQIPAKKPSEPPNPSPNDTTNNSNSTHTISKHEADLELARATLNAQTLLSSMSGTCLYFISGWWSYRFCYNESVRQFHQLTPQRGVPAWPPMEDPGVVGFTLGKYAEIESGAEKGVGKDERKEGMEGKEEEKAVGELVQRGDSRYLVQRLEGGTKCDLTGRERRIEVQFHCNPQTPDRISLIKETSTCAYLMIIQTPRLCHDVAFLPPQKDEPNKIICSPVLKEGEVGPYEKKLEDVRQAEPNKKVEQAVNEAAQIFTGAPPPAAPPQVAGGIIIGARNIVPAGLTIEKSSIVGGGKIKLIDTVASSDGPTLSSERMKELGLGDPKAVEKLKKQLSDMAREQGEEKWKLELIETERGKEYRGIIGSDDKDDKDDESKKEGSEKGEEERKDEGEDGGEGSREEYYHEEL